MFRLNRLVFGLALAASFLVANVHPAYACSCDPLASPVEELARSTAVFAGNVVGIDAPSGAVIISMDPVRVTFRVSKVWKGPIYATLAVTTARSGASCGYEFEAGRDYLVYAVGTDQGLTVSLCSRTQPLSAADEDLAVLGDGTVPAAPNPDVLDRILPNLLAVVFGFGAGLTIIAILFIRRRRLE